MQPRRLAFAALFAAVIACGDDMTVVPEESESKPVCMLLVDTHGYWQDDHGEAISDVFGTGHVASQCMCMTEEELESRSLHADLNDLLLEECERLAGLFEFDWNECQKHHDSGLWVGFTYRAWNNYWDFLVPPDLVCE